MNILDTIVTSDWADVLAFAMIWASGFCAYAVVRSVLDMFRRARRND